MDRVTDLRSYGFNPSKEDADRDPEKDWVFGATSVKCLYHVPREQRKMYLPQGELQNIGEEKNGCVTRFFLNKLATKFTYADQTNIMHPTLKQWGRDTGYATKDGIWDFADAFNEILSGTTRQGNSFKAVGESIRKVGVIPKAMLPQLGTWDAHMARSRITPAMLALGQEFLRRFTLNYEQVYLSSLEEALESDLVGLGVYAWPLPINGEYPQNRNPFNHAVMAFDKPLTFIFDNYLDTDGDFIKKLAADYKMYEYGYRIYVATETPAPVDTVGILTSLWRLGRYDLWAALWRAVFSPTPKPTPEPTPPPPAPKLTWGTFEQNKRTVAAICDDEGLNEEQKATLVATVWGESAFKLDAKNENKDAQGRVLSTDWGICQINDYYHIGPGRSFPTARYVLDNPEACIRWMCKQWKLGNRNWWIAYKSGAYRRHL